MRPLAARLRKWFSRSSKAGRARAPGIAETEPGYSLEVAAGLRAAHRKRVLEVYDAMHGSSLTHTPTVGDFSPAWSFDDRTHLEIHLKGWPPEDSHRAWAVDDLESWPEAVRGLAKFLKAFDAANEASTKVLGDLRKILREFLGSFGLEPRSAARGLNRGYDEAEVIRRGILQRVAEGDHYRIAIRWDPRGSVCAVQDGQAAGDLACGLSAEEASRVIEVLEHLPQRLNEFKGDRMFFAKWTGDILKLQVAFAVAETDLFQFKCGLDAPREHLRKGSDFPDGGHCAVCQDIRRRAQHPEARISGAREHPR